MRLLPGEGWDINTCRPGRGVQNTEGGRLIPSVGQGVGEKVLQVRTEQVRQ